MSNDVGIDLVLRGQTAGGKSVAAVLDQVEKSADRAGGAINKLDDETKQAEKSAALFQRTIYAVTAALSIREVSRFSDQITTMETRLRNVTDGANEFRTEFNALFAVAQRNGDALGGLIDNYVRLNTSLPESISKTTDLIKVTDLLSRGFAASGTAAQASGDVLTQLTQGLSGNFANAAQELNSLIEGAPLLARTIAVQLGGHAATDLKRFAEEGKLTAQIFLDALLASEDAINSYELPPTLERSWERVTNQIARMGSESATLEAVAAGVAGSMDFLAENMDLVASGMTVVAGAIAGALVPAMLSGIKTAGLMVAALATGPAAIFVAAGAAAGALYLVATRTTELDDIQSEHLSTMDKVREYNEKIAVSSGKVAESLRSEREEIFQTSVQRINATKALLNEAIARQLVLEKQNSQAGAGGLWGGMAVSQAATDVQELRDQLNAMGTNLNEMLDSMYKSKPATPSVVKQLTTEATGGKTAHDELTRAIEGSRTAEERLIKEIEKMQGMRGLVETVEEASGLEQAIVRANNELDDLRIQVDRNGPVARAFESFTNQIDDGMRESFREAFVASDRGWKSLLDGWKAGFKAFIAELAYTALMRPIVLQVAAGIGAGLGISTGAMGQIMGDLGNTGLGAFASGTGGIGLGSLSTIVSMLSGSLFSETLGSFGYDLMKSLGFDHMTSIGGIDALGNMGYGALGGIAASLLGLGNQNAIANMAAGGIGSIAGGFLGGPLGAAAGGFIGTAIGGLFGGAKPSDKTQAGGLDLATLETYGIGGLTGSKFSQENADFRDAVLSEASNVAKLLQTAGGTSSGKLMLIVGNRDGLRLRSGEDQVERNFGTNSEAFVEAALKAVVDQTTGLSEIMQKIVNITGVSDTDKLAQSINFGLSYEALLNPKEPADALTTALEALEVQFEALYDQARDFGLSLDPLTTEYERQKVAVTELIKAQQAGFASMEAMKATFDSWLYDQSMGSTSTLSPTQKLMEAQNSFGSLLESIRGGDSTKTQELLLSATQLLQIGQNMYASSVDFALLESFVRDSIGSVARQLGVEGYATGTMNARAGLRWVGERGPELVNFRGGERVYNAEESKAMARGNAANEARFATMGQDMAAMREDIAYMSKQLSRVANQMIVTGNK